MEWSDCARRDPSGTMIAFADMMRKQIVMPAHLMNDNEHMENNKRNLFKDFSSVAQATGTYTGQVGTSHLDLHRLHQQVGMSHLDLHRLH